MRINLIFAQANNGVIGHNNQLPWHLPQDLAHFKAHTNGCPVVMGRNTWDSLPPAFRPLPGRLNLVVSRNAALSIDGAQVCNSVEQALLTCAQHTPSPPEVWVIGGAQIYAQAMPLAIRAIITHLHADYPGDAFAPTFDNTWTETARQVNTVAHGVNAGLQFDFVTLEKHHR